MLKYLIAFAFGALAYYHLSEWMDEATKAAPCRVVARMPNGAVYCSDGRKL